MHYCFHLFVKYKSVGISLFILCLLSLFVCQKTIYADTPAITVHLDQPIHPVNYRASGFTSDAFARADIDPTLMTGIHTKFRKLSVNAGGTWWFDYDRLMNAGGALVLTLNDPIIEYNESYPFPGINGDYTAWDQSISSFLGMRPFAPNTEYEPWNEPDHYFYNFIPNNGWQVYKNFWAHTYTYIKNMDYQNYNFAPAHVDGPSLSGYDYNKLTDFLLFANAQFPKVLPDVLTWHENVAVSGAAAIVDHVTTMRQFMAANGLPDIPIDIQEYTSIEDQDNPGVVAHFFKYLEVAPIRYAGRSCWWQAGVYNHCDDFSLNGLRTPYSANSQNSNLKKGTHFAYEAYANMTGNIVETVGSGAIYSGRLEAVASYDDASQMTRILIGTSDAGVSGSLVMIKGIPSTVKNNQQITVNGWIIPYNGGSVVDKVKTINDLKVTYSDTVNAQVGVVIPQIPLNSAYELTLHFDGVDANTMYFGQTGDKPVVGNWNGGTKETLGVFRPDTQYNVGKWYLCMGDNSCSTVLSFTWGLPGDIPLACDWNNTGVKKPGLYRNGQWFLSPTVNPTGQTLTQFYYGPNDSNIVPICGDWDGINGQSVGIFNKNTAYFQLRNTNSTGNADIVKYYGIANDLPIAGKWAGGSGLQDTIGLYRIVGTTPGAFYLNYQNTDDITDVYYSFSPSGTPVVGNFYQNGIKVGVFNNGTWSIYP